ncbi:hypothetical protein CC2G_005007 [Coprinopsis cinerea AmutBmut pab1-1]|nr:hypothetical protein CC2G_005007 [Coprinopsis cinerea AmutBmut pab1-1]
MELTASFLSAVAVASTFVGTALSATTVPGCYAECIEKGAAAVNCAVDDIDCLRLASSQFTTITRECLDTNNCTSLTPGTPADEASITTTFNILSGLGLIDSSEVFSLADVLQVHQRDLTGLSRILPIDKRQSMRKPLHLVPSREWQQQLCRVQRGSVHRHSGHDVHMSEPVS